LGNGCGNIIPFCIAAGLGNEEIGLCMISVLYVDDWSPLLDILCQFLERKRDIVVETSLSIEEALRKLDYISFDVIVTDYNSKESSGIDLLRQTRRKGMMTPFVFFTLEQNCGMEQGATRYGSVAFVPKLPNTGSNFDKLETTIRTMVPASYSAAINQQKDLFSPTHGWPQS
jgi:DNA-binding NtrC family response regulator